MSITSKYLAVYNAASFSLWAYLAFLSLTLGPSLYTQNRLQDLYDALLFPFLAGTQSLAVIEVVHAAAGLVRSSPVTTAIQVIGKNLVVWTVMVQFPEIIVGPARQGSVGIWGFLGCVVFWGLSEIIRYGYFTVLLLKGDTPSWLKWLRYSAFIPLYPPGLLSEAFLVFLSLTKAENVSLPYRMYLTAGFLSYIPASYIMYTHMLSQRRKVFRSPRV